MMKYVPLILVFLTAFVSYAPAAFTQNAGEINYNSKTGDYQYYDGTTWQTFAKTEVSPACLSASPGALDYVAGKAGGMRYCATDGKVYQLNTSKLAIGGVCKEGAISYNSSLNEYYICIGGSATYQLVCSTAKTCG